MLCFHWLTDPTSSRQPTLRRWQSLIRQCLSPRSGASPQNVWCTSSEMEMANVLHTKCPGSYTWSWLSLCLHPNLPGMQGCSGHWEEEGEMEQSPGHQVAEEWIAENSFMRGGRQLEAKYLWAKVLSPLLISLSLCLYYTRIHIHIHTLSLSPLSYQISLTKHKLKKQFLKIARQWLQIIETQVWSPESWTLCKCTSFAYEGGPASRRENK